MALGAAAVVLRPDALMDTALGAIGRASEMVRTSPPGELTRKGARDVASEVDYAVEDIVRGILREATPDIGFLGEEGGSSGPEGLVWVLDPIDGTVNFTRGLPLCAISLALARGDQPVLGVIDLPFLGTRYTALEGRGTFRDGRRIAVSGTARMDEALVGFGDFAVGRGAETQNALRLDVVRALASEAYRTRMLGSAAVDLAWLAEGRLDASIILSNKPWDTAAGSLIAREAGAAVVDVDGAPHTLASRFTLAAGPGLIGRIAGMVRWATGGGAGRGRPRP